MAEAQEGAASTLTGKFCLVPTQFDPMMTRHWKASANQTLSLADSYDLFLTLRKAGIRAHGWL